MGLIASRAGQEPSSGGQTSGWPGRLALTPHAHACDDRRMGDAESRSAARVLAEHATSRVDRVPGRELGGPC